uniref:Mitochondrial import receptor subunit TOM22 homolog n=1 Tax=Nymphaea colorata TaxID=210225 RepID=A0A5K0WLL1_9MAGN
MERDGWLDRNPRGGPLPQLNAFLLARADYFLLISDDHEGHRKKGEDSAQLVGKRSGSKRRSSGDVSSSIHQSLIFQKGKKAASATAVCSLKLLCNIGKVAWIANTTFLMIIIPLIIEMDGDQQMNDLELQQSSLLDPPSSMMPLPK